jgi:hypothetical protein
MRSTGNHLGWTRIIMAKVSPIVRSFNAGEFSPLMEGRTDIDRYPASMRAMINAVAAPQGPVICRGGTEFVNEAFSHSTKSVLVPFVFSETDFYMIEFADLRVRFFTETGILTYTPQTVSAMSTGPFTFTSATLGAAIGDQVAFSDFPANYNLNGVVANITNKVGNVYTVDIPFPALSTLTSFKVARVYHIVSPYTAAQIVNVKDTPSLDVVYLTHGSVKLYKLQRKDTYDWSFVAVALDDGPYLPTNETKTTFSLSATGKATPDMTSNTLPSGNCTGSSVLAGLNYFNAFDAAGNNTYWEPDSAATAQQGIIQYDPASSFVCDGYSIQIPVNNADTSYQSKDYAPSNFTFEGWNGSAWVVLDTQVNYVLYDNNKSTFFKIPNTTSYSKYRLNILGLTRNGNIRPRVKSLTMRSTASTTLTLTASAVTGINNDTGFKSTDVGRLIRLKGSDNVWRQLKITAFTNTTTVTVQLLGEPFPDLNPSASWRLGAYSDTTGHPNTATFHDDCFWLGGTTAFPDFFAKSITGAYESFAPTTETGEVLATSGYAGRLNARRLSKIKWMESNKDGLAMGTGSKEYLLRSQDSTNKTLNPKDGIKAVDSGSRGSSDMPPVAIDSQVLFGSRGGRTIREFAYTYETDGYKSPSMSSLASHLGISPFVRQAYAAEPFSIDWILRANGTIVGLTYNRDENVVGWHRHDFGGVVESLAVLPSNDQLQDVLWLVVKRTIDGSDKRYIEKLTRFWDFDSVIEDAHFVDCGLRYVGSPTDRIYGLQHLEGREDIYGLADNIPVGPFTVTDGYVDLDTEASNVVLGIGFESYGETSRLENGAADGTAQGKLKRMQNVSVNVWQSYGGEIGTWNEQTQEVEWVPLDEHYRPTDATEIETIELRSGILGPITPAPGYEKNGSVYFRRRKDQPYPFNIVAFMPQMVTQDR